MKNLFFTALLLTSFSAYAEEYLLDSDIHSKFVKVDKQLNTTYQSIIKTLPASIQNKLKQNQRDWLKYSTGFCSLTDGHPMQSQTELCLTPIFENRINELKSTQCQEGDMSPFCL